MYKVNLRDLSQLYDHSLLLYKGEIVYVSGFIEESYFVGKKFPACAVEKYPYEHGDLQPIPKRIGYINTFSTAIYGSRVSKRAYSVGLTYNNVRFTPASIRLNIPQEVKELQSIDIYHALMGVYPSLREAINLLDLNKDRHSIAFDKQFAITFNRDILYKNKKVGRISRPCKQPKYIVWNDGCEHYSFLLEPDYEKTIRTFTS